MVTLTVTYATGLISVYLVTIWILMSNFRLLSSSTTLELKEESLEELYVVGQDSQEAHQDFVSLAPSLTIELPHTITQKPEMYPQHNTVSRREPVPAVHTGPESTN